MTISMISFVLNVIGTTCVLYASAQLDYGGLDDAKYSTKDVFLSEIPKNKTNETITNPGPSTTYNWASGASSSEQTASVNSSRISQFVSSDKQNNSITAHRHGETTGQVYVEQHHTTAPPFNIFLNQYKSFMAYVIDTFRNVAKSLRAAKYSIIDTRQSLSKDKITLKEIKEFMQSFQVFPYHNRIIPDEDSPTYLPVCPQNWKTNKERCYRFFIADKPMAINEAKTECERYFGHLANSKTAELDILFTSLAVNRTKYIFLGGELSTASFTWEWTDGSGFKYTNWRYKPDMGLDWMFRKCMLMELTRVNNYTVPSWLPFSCQLKKTDKVGYICERPLSYLPPE